MSFWMFVLAFFVSPAYFAIRKKWGAFIVNSVLYLLALVTVWVFGIGLIFWVLGVGHAAWDIGHAMREQTMQRQAELIAEKMSKSRGDQ